MVLLNPSHRSVESSIEPNIAPNIESNRSFLARRRALIAQRAAVLCRRGLPVENVHSSFTFHPSAAPILGEPVLSPAERARVRVEVAIARDAEEWKIGRGSPCMWLVAVGG